MAIIEATGLTRVFTSRRRQVEAVRGVDITVSPGEIVGFLGPNGAGKTTTLRMLTTLLKPTAGHATVAGADLLRDPLGVRRRIGYVAQAIGATAGGSDPNCTVAEELQIQGQVTGSRRPQAAEPDPPADRASWSWAGWRTACARPCPAASAAAWTSRSGWCTPPA